MIRFNEIFPPRPSMEDLGMEAKRQAYSAATGIILKRGILPDVDGLNPQQLSIMPTIFGYPDIVSSMELRRLLKRRGPTLNLFDVDGVIVPNTQDDYNRSGFGRLTGSKIIRSVFMGSEIRSIADIPANEDDLEPLNSGERASLAISRSLKIWPRQKALRNIFQQSSIGFIDHFDRHNPPMPEKKKPEIWSLFEQTLTDLVRPLNLGSRPLNLNHHGDILPPISFLAGNEGVIIHWLSKFFTTLGIETNPNITFINPFFPKTGMILDPNTFEFLPLNGAEV